jgi:hypothetical protein
MGIRLIVRSLVPGARHNPGGGITRSRMRYAPSPSARRTGCSPARSGPAAALPQSKACSPPPNSMASIPRAGWPRPSKNSLPARTARSTHCYRSQTLHRPDARWKVGRLAAYTLRAAKRGVNARLVLFMGLCLSVRAPMLIEMRGLVLSPRTTHQRFKADAPGTNQLRRKNMAHGALSPNSCFFRLS